MMETLCSNRQTCYQKFHMYPPMLRHFAHVLCDEYDLSTSKKIDIYELVGMFLCILVHGKGYHQVTTIFNHSMVCYYFK